MTLKRLLTGVDKLMGLQVTFSDKALAASLNAADVGSISSVRSHVSFEIACLIERPHTSTKRAKQMLIRSVGPSKDLNICLA